MPYGLAWDRLLGAWVASIATPVQPGRYRILGPQGQLIVLPLVDGSAELPDRHAEALEPLDAEKLNLNARAVEMLAAERPTATSADALILALGLEPAEEEDAALIGFHDAHGAFNRVMNNPAELLERRDELTGMGHGGRITPRTLRRLASHTDDWRARRNRVVEPRRLLVERLYPHLDRSENRLVINTLILLKQRLDVLADDAAGQSQLHDTERLHSLHFRAARRSTELWSRALSKDGDEDVTRSLEQRNSDLDVALTSIDNLSNSTLGRALAPWRRRPADGAFGSNLLRDHEAYSKIGRLWQQLFANADLDYSARRAIAIRREERFDAYVLACVSHAVRSLTESRQQSAGLVSQPTIRRDTDGAVTVTVSTLAGENRAVRVVPQFTVFGDTPSTPNAPDQNGSQIILAQAANPGASELLRLGTNGTPTVVGVGPYVLTGVEALGSALRWHLEAKELLRYPIRLRLPQILAAAAKQLVAAGLVVRVEANNLLAVVSVADDSDFADLARDALSSKASTQHLDAAIHDFRAAVSWTRALRFCLACGTDAHVFQPDGDRFLARCRSCDAAWGIDLCPAGHRRPFLRFPADSKDRGMDRWAPRDDDPCPRCLAAAS